MSVLASVMDVVQFAHDLGYPHQEPVRSSSGGGGGASAIVILAAIAASVVAVAGLIWLKRRSDA
jgi:hypothetical protein